MEFYLPEPVRKALDILTNAGHEAYLVGGCVRDALRGTVPHDYDIATDALPEETLAVFSGYRTIATGIRHGTVTALLDRMPIEITTYRVDGAYADHRRPDDVTFTSSLREDLARRDFTVNAMAYHPDYGLVDPFFGQEDLSAGIIRAVGEPTARFTEDALRILRAMRFSARFGFAIEDNTKKAIFSLSDTLTFIAPERVREELVGIIVAKEAECVMREYASVLSVICPQGVLTEAFAALPADTVVLRLADFLLTVGENGARRALSALRFDNKTAKEVCTVISLYGEKITADHECICRLLRRMGETATRQGFELRAVHGIDDAASITVTENILTEKFPYTLGMLAIGGEDLVALGAQRGPRIGELLELLYTAVVRKEIENEREAMLDYIKRYI